MDELNRIESEINILKAQTAQNIIEIGRRLIEAKALVLHGEWGKWLSERVDMTQNTAHRLMRVARELPNCAPAHNLDVSKAFELLALPEDIRAEFIDTYPVEDMTKQQLREAVKATKKAEAERDEYLAQAEETKRMIEEIKNQPPHVEVRTEFKPIVPEDYEEAKRRAKQAEQEAAEYKRRADEAEAKQRAEHERMMDHDKKRREAQDELFQMKKAMASNSTLQGEYNPLNFSQYWMACKNFLDRVSPLTYMGEELHRMDDKTKGDYFKWLSMIENWTQDMKDALNGVVIEGEIL